MKAALLPDRGVVKVAGDGAAKLPQRAAHRRHRQGDARSAARFAALLTPQGKIIVDFIVAEAPAGDGGGFFLDCPRALAPTLVERLNFYKLRAKVIGEDLSEVLGVLALWDGAATTEYGLVYRDPRLPALGLRVMLPPHLAAEAAADLGAALVDAAAYEAHRIALGVPRGGPRFHLWRRLPARDRHGPARRRRFRQGLLRRPGGGLAHGAPRHRAHPRVCRSPSTGLRPEAGIAVTAGDKPVGTMGSSAGGRALAMLRLDRVADALAAGAALVAGGVELRLVKPDWARFAFPGEAKGGRMSALLHPDGLARCPWPKHDPLYVAYHDDEWGVPEYDDRALYEKLVLDGFQAGLSWITILRKRENFRRAFDGFEPAEDRALRPKRRSRR